MPAPQVAPTSFYGAQKKSARNPFDRDSGRKYPPQVSLTQEHVVDLLDIHESDLVAAA